MLNLLVSLKPPSDELIKTLLVLLAQKNLGLRETLLRLLGEFGVAEAEEWLWPELESWEDEQQDQPDQPDTWTSLQCRADRWLELWISKYKEHNRYLYLRSTAKWKPLTANTVDVLNYFCSVQKEQYNQARSVAPAGQNNTVLMPLHDCSYKPILRLGETYTMARTRKPGLILPPLRSRPFLTRFPRFISFPLSYITLSPFHNYSDEDWLKASAQRRFNHQESLVEYYR
ncbi:WD repeat-containing protein 97 [Salarias fasciatus]|uniref:WD repeat-containing protein 97 n=1 Tax=Salarias fasciatus TaxID=181472 RepID=UPI0011764EF7|nr:uncharacterized protein LOC115394741 [Salarias fasciatus]